MNLDTVDLGSFLAASVIDRMRPTTEREDEAEDFINRERPESALDDLGGL